jgi:CheY-like chemotaxis protein
MGKSAIIFVDDELLVLQSLKAQSRKWFGDQYLYECAQSADEAWEVIDDLALDGVDILIIVSDWLMPGIRGDEFLIAVHRKYPRVVTMMLTGHADRQAIDRAREEANLFTCVSKPWTEEELMTHIKNGLENL